jgi:hypothetical protein
MKVIEVGNNYQTAQETVNFLLATTTRDKCLAEWNKFEMMVEMMLMPLLKRRDVSELTRMRVHTLKSFAEG